VADQVDEQLEHLRLDGDGDTAATQLAALLVRLEVAEPDQGTPPLR
jgi:hypothetical protein